MILLMCAALGVFVGGGRGAAAAAAVQAVPEPPSQRVDLAPSRSSALHVTLTLRSDHILAGQPLVLFYTFSDGSSEPVTIYPAATGEAPWFTLSLRGADGDGHDLSPAVEENPWVIPVAIGGANRQATRSGGLNLRGGQFPDLMPPVLSSQSPPRPYVRHLLLVAKVRLPYSAGEETAAQVEANPTKRSLLPSPRAVVEREIVLPFTVEYDAQKLERLARDLADRLTPKPETAPNVIYLPNRADLIALFRLYGDGPQKVQREFLKSFSDKPRAEIELSTNLYRIGLNTPEVIDLLAELTWKYGGKESRNILALMYEDAQRLRLPEVQAHIERIFAEHHEKIPRGILIDG